MKFSRFWKPVVSASVYAARRVLTAILLAAAVVLFAVSPGFADDGTVRVMTRNLYQGTSFDGVINAGTFPDLWLRRGRPS